MSSFIDPYQALIATYIFVIGLCVGSFLNVVILRGIDNEDIVFKPSRCPKCQKNLKWYMNIPLISYIFLKGKCAYCNSKISIQYPLVELICAILFVLSYLNFGLNLNLMFIWSFIALSLIMAVTDIKITAIIDTHAYISAVLGLIYSFFYFSPLTPFQSIAGGIAGYFTFEILSFISKKIIGYRMFGEGDSLIALALGLFLGFRAMPIVILLSFLIQFFIAIPFLLSQAYGTKNKLLFSAYLTIIFGLAGVIYINFFDLINRNYGLYLILSALISLLLLFALVILFRHIRLKAKENTQAKAKDEILTSFCTLPFGPSLLISGILCLFYLENFIDLFKKIYQ